MTAAPPCRRPDWHPRLQGFLATATGRPFAHGTHDCALFVAGAVEAMTGSDPGARYRGRYTTLKGGLKLVGRDGLADHVAVFARVFAEVPPALAAAGDIAVIGEVGTPALGIFGGEAIFVLRAGGLGLMPRAAATRALQVP